jgi:hypothetical protein
MKARNNPLFIRIEARSSFLASTTPCNRWRQVKALSIPYQLKEFQ